MRVLGSVLLACVFVSAIDQYTGITSAEADEQRRQLANRVNSDVNSTWKATLTPISRFAGKDYSPLRMMAGVVGGPSENAANLPIKSLEHYAKVFGKSEEQLLMDIPEAFDARVAWPQCPIIKEIRDQSACGSCYAVSVASTASDRYCIGNNGTKSDRLSAVDLMSCCKSCGNNNGGCDGGSPSKTWDYVATQGIATGGSYGDYSKCLSYPFPPCDHHDKGTHGTCSPTPYNAPTCWWQCDTNTTDKNSYDSEQAAHKFATSYKVDPKVSTIQADILAHGPATASMFLVPEFEVYSTGVFFTNNSGYIGAHAVKIIGWGTAGKTPYWLVANSWNTEWGESGTFRIMRGGENLGIEKGVVGGSWVAF